MFTTFQPFLVLRPAAWGAAITLLSFILEGTIAPAAYASMASPPPTARTIQPRTQAGFPLAQGNPAPRVNRKAQVMIPPGGRNRGQVGKGECPHRQPDLWAMVPLETDETKGLSAAGFSLTNRPTLWLYTPYLASDGHEATMTLRVRSENPGASPKRVSGGQQTIALPQQSGVIGVSLPEGITLEPGRWYEWIFEVKCQPIKSVVLLVRYEPDADLLRSIQAKSPEERERLYLENGYWFDAVTTLAEQRRQQPQSQILQQRWESLLRTKGFEEIISQPLAK